MRMRTQFPCSVKPDLITQSASRTSGISNGDRDLRQALIPKAGDTLHPGGYQAHRGVPRSLKGEFLGPFGSGGGLWCFIGQNKVWRLGIGKKRVSSAFWREASRATPQEPTCIIAYIEVSGRWIAWPCHGKSRPVSPIETGLFLDQICAFVAGVDVLLPGQQAPNTRYRLQAP